MKLYRYYITGISFPGGKKGLSTIPFDELCSCIRMLASKHDPEQLLRDAGNLLPGQYMYAQNVGWIICLSIC